MSKTYALVSDYAVQKLLELTEDEVQVFGRVFQNVIDCDGIVPTPQVGWKFDGRNFLPPTDGLSEEGVLEAQCVVQRQFGQKMVLNAVDRIGARNLLLINNGVPIDIPALLTQMMPVKILLETGALKTARGALVQIKQILPTHADILDGAIVNITQFLVTNGYE
jgi:hypothetical protein